LNTLTLIRHLAYEKDVSINERKEIEKVILKLYKNKRSLTPFKRLLQILSNIDGKLWSKK